MRRAALVLLIFLAGIPRIFPQSRPETLDGRISLFWPKSHALFSTMPAVVSRVKYPTPSGEFVFGIKPSARLDHFFPAKSGKLKYLYVTAADVPMLPSGLKAFALPGKNAVPVLWVPPDLKGAVHPGDRITLLLPGSRALLIAGRDRTAPSRDGDWFAGEIHEPAESPQTPRDGKSSYEALCLRCHGKYGNGQGPASIFLFPKPRNFQSGEYKFKTTFPGDFPSDIDLYRTITHGLRGTSMPGFGNLPPRIRWDLVAYIKKFSLNEWKSPRRMIDWRRIKRIFEEKEEKTEVELGRELFSGKAKCNDCHGPGGKSKDGLPHGDGPSSPAQIDDWGYPDQPADLASGRLKRGNSFNSIYAAVTTGIPGTSMPGFDGVLSEKERAAVAIYVSHLNRAHKGGLRP